MKTFKEFQQEQSNNEFNNSMVTLIILGLIVLATYLTH